MSFSNYMRLEQGVQIYDFSKIDSTDICHKVEYTVTQKEKYERVKAVIYMVVAFGISMLLQFSLLNTFVAEVVTIYFFSSDAWKRSEHYANMREMAALRIVELADPTFLKKQELNTHEVI